MADVEVTSRLHSAAVGKPTGPGAARPAKPDHFRAFGTASPAARATSRASLGLRTQRRDRIGQRRSHPVALGDAGAARAAMAWKAGARCHSIGSIRFDLTSALCGRACQPAFKPWIRGGSRIRPARSVCWSPDQMRTLGGWFLPCTRPDCWRVLNVAVCSRCRS